MTRPQSTYTTADAAKDLGVSPRQVGEYIRKGLLPADKVGSGRGTYLISAVALRKFREEEFGKIRPRGVQRQDGGRKESL